jgi:hypothetical protein
LTQECLRREKENDKEAQRHELYDSGSCLEAKISSIIRNGDWFWPKARSDNLVDIQSKLLDIPFGGADVPIWKSISGVYTCLETWDCLRTKLPVVPWSKR